MDFTVLNYQGSKQKLRDFIFDNLSQYLPADKALLDIFSGSAAVSEIFKKNRLVFANDTELFASIIADAILNKPKALSDEFYLRFNESYSINYQHIAKFFEQYILLEETFISTNDKTGLINLYETYPTIWNKAISPITGKEITATALRNSGEYCLFLSYYANSYFGIRQSAEIDAIIKTINNTDTICQNVLFSCLFYAMKEAVFSKDGHMAQPLNLTKDYTRLIKQRKKNIYECFLKKYSEYLNIEPAAYSGRNLVYNEDFNVLLGRDCMKDVGLIYADPPYTDMQYSRYYHLLNVAARYNFPEPSIVQGKYTTGLYTEGRYQSKLSQRNAAKNQMAGLVSFCAQNNINLAISFAYPQDTENQATDRYVMSIDDILDATKQFFPIDKIRVVTQTYNHANQRNSTQKKVLEYLVLCGTPNATSLNYFTFKNQLLQIVPSKNNPMYNSHIYWSQKSYNVCDYLIKSFSKEGDVIFDPFMGSGVTILEAIKKGMDRAAIGCDINDLPLFISKTLLNINSIKSVEALITEFSAKITPLISHYHTVCPYCGNTGIVTKVIFNKMQRVGNDYNVTKIYYKCSNCKHTEKMPDRHDIDQMHSNEPLHYVKDIELLQNSKIAVCENDSIKNIFTERNLSVLDKILAIIETYNSTEKEILQYILMSILHLCKITDTHSNSQWPLWIPKENCVEKNVIELLIKKLKSFMQVKDFMKENYGFPNVAQNYSTLKKNTCLLLKKGSQFIKEDEIPNNGVDLIITDPPYLDQVLYSEYLQLYSPFFNMDINFNDEIVVSTAVGRNKDRENYFELMDQVFAMCSKKLKLNHHLCLYFHDSNLTVWDQLISILERNHFRFIMQAHIEKSMTVKNIISPKKSLNGDSVLIFIKDDVTIAPQARESIQEIERNIITQATAMINQYGHLTTPQIYDNGLIEILIQNGWLSTLSKKYNTIVDLLEKHLRWDPVNSYWTK